MYALSPTITLGAGYFAWAVDGALHKGTAARGLLAPAGPA